MSLTPVKPFSTSTRSEYTISHRKIIAQLLWYHGLIISRKPTQNRSALGSTTIISAAAAAAAGRILGTQNGPKIQQVLKIPRLVRRLHAVIPCILIDVPQDGVHPLVAFSRRCWSYPTRRG